MWNEAAEVVVVDALAAVADRAAIKRKMFFI